MATIRAGGQLLVAKKCVHVGDEIRQRIGMSPSPFGVAVPRKSSAIT